MSTTSSGYAQSFDQSQPAEAALTQIPANDSNEQPHVTNQNARDCADLVSKTLLTLF